MVLTLTGKAALVANQSHKGQVDKAGLPYISHVSRVATNVARAGGGDKETAVAWLHDTVEDTAVTLDWLRQVGFPEEIVLDVDALTKRKGESTADYYVRVMARPRAHFVKVIGDLADNMDPTRPLTGDAEGDVRRAAKYTHAAKVLGVPPWPPFD